MKMNLLYVLFYGRVEPACYVEKVSKKFGDTVAGINTVNKEMSLCLSH